LRPRAAPGDGRGRGCGGVRDGGRRLCDGERPCLKALVAFGDLGVHVGDVQPRDLAAPANTAVASSGVSV